MRLGDSGFKKSIYSFAMLSGVLFLRAWEQGERLIVAMDARCYSGKLGSIEQRQRADPWAIFAVLGYLAAIAATAYLTKDLVLL
jgi:cobalt/nickel transport system permease protein